MPSGILRDDGDMVTCALCGRTEDQQPITWTTSVELVKGHRTNRLYCDQCSRENVRGIEGKLDSDWW